MGGSTKLRRYSRILLLLLMLGHLKGFAQYPLHILPMPGEPSISPAKLGLTTSFKSREACEEYIYSLPKLLQGKGYMTASVDSMSLDSAAATIHLYVGRIYHWAYINTRKVEPALLAAVSWNDKSFANHALDFAQYKTREKLLLDYLENNGYPFAKISLDSIVLSGQDEISANLKIDKGPLYKIDSIRVYGTARISKEFLGHYLNIPDGSIYRKERLEAIHKKILELPYVQEVKGWTLTMLSGGAVINLYLKPKKSSQIDALVGFLPGTDPNTGASKVVVTGEATVDLKNALGNGESISLNWQQLQPSSPRLTLGFQQPYLFNTPFGLFTSFDLYKQDSSYLNLNIMLGAQYALSANQSGSVFLQEKTTSLLNVDTLTVIATHALPEEADVSSTSIGMTYNFNNTNYRYNPLRGNDVQFIGTVGTRKIKKNTTIEQLIDPNDSAFNFASLYDTVRMTSYEFMAQLTAAHYFQLTRASTLKLGFNGGVFSSPNSYRNELFLIGGYKLLRGFDEASILAAQYAVGTLEYHYLIGMNSYMFAFLDVGWAENNVPTYSLNSTYMGTGLGMAFETKAGIFNLSFAVGKQGSGAVDFHDSKIHLGYVSFF